MLSTAHVLRILAKANPDRRITEDTLRSCIRRGEVQLPPLFAGRYAWSLDDVANLARALGLNPPPAERCDSDRSRSRPDAKATGARRGER